MTNCPESVALLFHHCVHRCHLWTSCPQPPAHTNLRHEKEFRSALLTHPSISIHLLSCRSQSHQTTEATRHSHSQRHRWKARHTAGTSSSPPPHAGTVLSLPEPVPVRRDGLFSCATLTRLKIHCVADKPKTCNAQALSYLRQSRSCTRADLFPTTLGPPITILLGNKSQWNKPLSSPIRGSRLQARSLPKGARDFFPVLPWFGTVRNQKVPNVQKSTYKS